MRKPRLNQDTALRASFLKLVILWDNARYHCSKDVKAYLDQVNHDLEEKDWKITCLPFAPNAPQQNPVEDVWLKGKNFLRRHFF